MARDFSINQPPLKSIQFKEKSDLPLEFNLAAFQTTKICNGKLSAFQTTKICNGKLSAFQTTQILM